MLPKFETEGLVKFYTLIYCGYEHKKNRRPFNADFKVKVVLEALKERFAFAELSHKYEVIQVIISRWENEFLEAAAVVFYKCESTDSKGLEAANDRLITKIGRQKVEIDFLKKFSRNWEMKYRARFVKRAWILSVRKQFDLMSVVDRQHKVDIIVTKQSYT